jgi:ribonuclease III
MAITVDFAAFEKHINIQFKNKGLLQQAFIHRSYINENKGTQLEHNERLEFLGDAVLELAITDYLYRKYPHHNEGDLTAYRSSLVNAHTLSGVALTLGINDYLLLSKGEAKDKGRARQYILADTFEAIVGALYIDQGIDAASAFVGKHLFHLIDDIVAKGLWIDAKSRFQEVAQDKVGVTPAYKTMREEGPDHNKSFTVGVFLNTELVAEGKGTSKQEAEQEAARLGLLAKGW